MSFISPVGAQLSGYAFESLLYGCFIVYFIQCLQCLLRGPQLQSQVLVNRFMTAAASLLFICISAHWIINTARLGVALVEYGSVLQPGPLENYITRLGYDANDRDGTVFIVQNTLWITEVFIGDTILTYRLYSIWHSNWKIAVFPCVLLFTELSVAIAAAILNQRTNSLTVWMLLAFALNVTINIYCTGLIVHHMWRSSDVLCKYEVKPPRKTETVGRILIESAGIYAFANIAFLITFATNSNLQFLLTDPSSPAIGLIFCAIIVRARRKPDHEDEESGGLQSRIQVDKGGSPPPAVDEIYIHIQREVFPSEANANRDVSSEPKHLSRYDYPFNPPSNNSL